jgi:hypothetical protein
VNRLARERPDDVRALVEDGRELRSLQEAILAGQQPEGLTDLVARVRDRVDALAKAAVSIAAESGRPASGAVLQRVYETLLAAVGEEAKSQELLAGTLTREWAPAGFGFAPGAVATPRPAAARTSATGAPARDRGGRERAAASKRRVDKARRSLREAREQLAAREAERQRLEAKVREAMEAERAARDNVDRAERELDSALERAKP